MWRVTVNFLECYLIFCSDVEVLNVQPRGSGTGCLGASLPPAALVPLGKCECASDIIICIIDFRPGVLMR